MVEQQQEKLKEAADDSSSGYGDSDDGNSVDEAEVERIF